MYAKLEKFTKDFRQNFDDETFRVMYNNEYKRLRRVEIEDAKFQAYKKLCMEAATKVYQQRITNGEFEGMEELQELQEQIKNKNGNGGNIAPVYFVTVNPKEGTTLEQLEKCLRKYTSRHGLMTGYAYVIEQRGSTEADMGKGIHAHMLIKQRGHIFLNEFSKNSYNTFKNIVGSRASIFITPVRSEPLFNDKMEYMYGKKDTSEKMAKCAIDIIFRNKLGIQAMYKSEDFGWQSPSPATNVE